MKRSLVDSPDIYVLASGPSVTFMDPMFFAGKEVISVNFAAERLGIFDIATVTTHTHYHQDGITLAEAHPSSHVWMPQGDQGHAGKPTVRRDNITYYPHPPTKYDFTVAEAVIPGGLIVGSTSLHGAMHLACVMGARNVLLVGADCGTIDGRANVAGYDSGNLVNDDPGPWLARWETHLRMVKAWLVDKYQVNIYSINPFVNMNLEGHTWSN